MVRARALRSGVFANYCCILVRVPPTHAGGPRANFWGMGDFDWLGGASFHLQNGGERPSLVSWHFLGGGG